MANVTVTLDDALLSRARFDAERAGKSLSRYLADLIEAEDARLRAASVAAMQEFLSLSAQVPLDRPDWKFDRDEIYDRPYPGGHTRGALQLGSGRSGEAGALRGVADSAGGDEFADDQSAGLQRDAKRSRKKT